MTIYNVDQFDTCDRKLVLFIVIHWNIKDCWYDLKLMSIKQCKIVKMIFQSDNTAWIVKEDWRKNRESRRCRPGEIGGSWKFYWDRMEQTQLWSSSGKELTKYSRGGGDISIIWSTSFEMQGAPRHLNHIYKRHISWIGLMLT